MRRLAALFLLALLLPAAAAAEKTEERVAQGIESVIDGMDFAAVLHGTTPAEAFAAYPVKRIMKTLDEIAEIDA